MPLNKSHAYINISNTKMNYCILSLQDLRFSYGGYEEAYLLGYNAV
jgi:hypothetical protein